MSVYEFSNYRDFLKDHLSKRAEINAGYSLRAFARFLNMGSSTLSEVLSGRTNLSIANARRIASRLKLKAKEVNFFCDLVQYESAKDPELKDQIAQRLQERHPQKRCLTNLSLEHFKQMSDWVHSAILELPLLPDFQMSGENIARTLSISKPQAELALERLLKLGLLERDQDLKIIRVEDHYKVQSEVRSVAMRKYYDQMLKKIGTALEEQSPQERLSGYINLPIDKAALSEVDDAITSFFGLLQDISAKYKNPKDVYHLSLHFISLTQGEKNV